MRILIADDEPATCKLLEVTLSNWGYRVETARDGLLACQILQHKDAPRFAILDWCLPVMDGLEICRQVRRVAREVPAYLVLLTANTGKNNVVEGLRAGADDYITKPFDRDELKARIRQGFRILDLQQALVKRICEANESLASVKQLQELLPICCYCKKIRDDQNYWQQVDTYLTTHLEARFSHGICPDCLTSARVEFQAG